MKTKILSCLSLVVLLAGCGTHRENMNIHPVCLSKPSTVVITQIEGLDKPYFYKVGNQGLIDAVVNEAVTSSVCNKIESIDAKPVVDAHYYKPFEAVFAGQSFKVTNVSEPLIRQELLPHAVDEARFAPFDFRPLKSRYGADYALILHPRLFGTERSYYGFIPTSKPKGLANLAVYLVKLEDNTLVGYYNTNVYVPAQGDWDTPPEYLALTDASKNALTKALNDAHAYLFSNIPKASV